MSLDGKPDSERLRSLDAYRGFVMLAMASGGVAALGGLGEDVDTLSANLVHVFKQQFDHAEWRGWHRSGT